MEAPIAIIAGRGRLPGEIARTVEAGGGSVILAALEGVDLDGALATARHVLRFRLERLAGLFTDLRAAGVDRVVMAGGIERPGFNPAWLDLRTAAMVPRILSALRSGDDAALRVAADLFEREGFAVIGVHDLVPGLLPDAGTPTRRQPGAADRADAARAEAIVAALSPADVGQAAVVAQGVALAVEAAPGTDRMLAWVAAVAGAWRPDPDGARGLLYKGPKIGQERRMDLPTIGPDTVRAVEAAGLGGIVIEAGGVLVVDRDAVVAACDAAGLFLWVRPTGVGGAI